MAYILLKAFNKNVVYCEDDINNRKCILIGKGIGFGVKEKQEILEINVDEVSYLYDSANMSRFEGLSKNIENDIVGVVEEVIALINSELKKELNEKIHVSLLDHVSFAIERHKNDIEIKNPFMIEIKSLYKQEFELASTALSMINDKLKIELPQDEVGFIAMHIHAGIKNSSISKTSLNTAIIRDMVIFIEEEIGCTIDKDGIDYARLVNHIRFALDRQSKKIPIKNVLLGSIKRKLKDSYNLSKKVAKKIEDEYNIKLSQDEIGYLAMHLEKVKDNERLS